jgi:hypothetical protein
MKIVKMHKGSREAFDGFIEQRLNEVEVDNDMADKYFADMNLPVPVIPVSESFLSKYKNVLGLFVLLASIGFAIVLFSVKTKKDGAIDEISINKEKALLEKQSKAIIDNTNNNIITSTVKETEAVEGNAAVNENIISVKKNKSTNGLINKNIASTDNNNFNNTFSKKKSEKIFTFLVKKNSISNINDGKLIAETVLTSDKITSTHSNIDNNNSTKITEIKPVKSEKKIETKNSDSLYIIW